MHTSASQEQGPRNTNHLAVKAGLALASSALIFTGGYVNGNHQAESAPTPGATTGDIEKSLNGHEIATDVTVEVGFAIPLTNGPEGAVAVINPIKLGGNRYGYIDSETLQRDGTVRVETVEYDGELQPNSYYGGYSDTYAHEVTTSLALVYQDYPMEMGKSGTYYSVIMGERGGNTDLLMNITPGASDQERNLQVNEQQGQIAEARAGELLYEGK